MSRQYYTVEFTIDMGAWGENEEEASNRARRKVLDSKDHLDEMLTNYDDCVEVADFDWDWDGPDAPDACDQCGATDHSTLDSPWSPYD